MKKKKKTKQKKQTFNAYNPRDPRAFPPIKHRAMLQPPFNPINLPLRDPPIDREFRLVHRVVRGGCFVVYFVSGAAAGGS